MTTQLEQDVALAESVGFQSMGRISIACTEDDIHAFANAIREQAVPDGYVVIARSSLEYWASLAEDNPKDIPPRIEFVLSAAPRKMNDECSE